MADYMSVVSVAAPVVAGVVGYFGKRLIDLKPRIIAFIASANSVTVGKSSSTPVALNSHVLVIRNDGGLVARDVRILHDFFPPDQSVYPGINYDIVTNPEGKKEIQLHSIVPGQQVTISYVYSPPTTFQNVNCHVVSEQGQAKIFWALPKPPPSFWQQWLRYMLMFYGGWALLYWIARVIYAVINKQAIFIGWQ